MGFINFRGGQKADHFQELSKEARNAEAAEKEAADSRKKRQNAAAYFGVPEMAEKDNPAVLSDLILKYRGLADLYAVLIQNTSLSKVFDASQLMGDFWLSCFTEVLNQGNLTAAQKEKCLQLLLHAFRIKNRTTAKEHFLFTEKNEAYLAYWNRCFEMQDEQIPLIWSWLQQLGLQPLSEGKSAEGNRMETLLLFLRKYLDYMAELSFYLNRQFPETGCGKDTKSRLGKMTGRIREKISGNVFSEIDLSQLVNPVYENPEAFRTDYRGAAQTRHQAKGAKEAFRDLTKNFEKEEKILRFVRLLDSCTENETGNLEREYRRMVKKL